MSGAHSCFTSTIVGPKSIRTLTRCLTDQATHSNTPMCSPIFLIVLALALIAAATSSMGTNPILKGSMARKGRTHPGQERPGATGRYLGTGWWRCTEERADTYRNRNTDPQPLRHSCSYLAKRAVNLSSVAAGAATRNAVPCFKKGCVSRLLSIVSRPPGCSSRYTTKMSRGRGREREARPGMS
jgi:hypothetical protein